MKNSSKLSRSPAFAIALCWLLSLVAGVAGLVNYYNLGRIFANPAAAAASVDDAAPGSKSVSVMFSFSARGETYRSTASMPDKRWQQLRVSTNPIVYYDPSDPNRCSIAPDFDFSNALWLVAGSIVLETVAFLALVIWLRIGRR